MNDLQKKELELLKIFIDICNQLNLKYYLVCGSALGAVKYNGFIPWDDDIDVGMPRNDYEVFLEMAPAILSEKYFLQTHISDNNYPNIFAKLRDSTTTYIEKSVAHISMNHGVYIDIFPLDGYPKSKEDQLMLEKRKKTYKRLLTSVYDVPRSLKGKLAVKLMRFLKIHKKTLYILKKYNKLISSYTIKDSSIICNHGNWQGTLEYAPKEQYGCGKWTEFEGIKVRVPEKFDDYLTQKYGDWRSDPPTEEQVGHHYYTYMDLDNPYTDYIK